MSANRSATSRRLEASVRTRRRSGRARSFRSRTQRKPRRASPAQVRPRRRPLRPRRPRRHLPRPLRDDPRRTSRRRVLRQPRRQTRLGACAFRAGPGTHPSHSRPTPPMVGAALAQAPTRQTLPLLRCPPPPHRPSRATVPGVVVPRTRPPGKPRRRQLERRKPDQLQRLSTHPKTAGFSNSELSPCWSPGPEPWYRHLERVRLAYPARPPGHAFPVLTCARPQGSRPSQSFQGDSRNPAPMPRLVSKFWGALSRRNTAASCVGVFASVPHQRRLDPDTWSEPCAGSIPAASILRPPKGGRKMPKPHGGSPGRARAGDVPREEPQPPLHERHMSDV